MWVYECLGEPTCLYSSTLLQSDAANSIQSIHTVGRARDATTHGGVNLA